MSSTALTVPLHQVVLFSDGEMAVGVRPNLPFEGVQVILGNELTGGHVWANSILPPGVTYSEVEDKDHPQVFCSEKNMLEKKVKNVFSMLVFPCLPFHPLCFAQS